MTDETKYTKGPFTVSQPEVFPFDIEVLGPDGEVAWSERRYAYSSRQRSVDECMRAVGFPHDERPGIAHRLESQLADVTLRAAAPEMLEALKLAKGWLELWESAERELGIINGVIAKAEGRSK